MTKTYPRLAGGAEPPRLAPRLVTLHRGGDSGAARTKVFAAASVMAPTDRLLSAMRTVKAARFNAAERFRRKNTLSMFSIVGRVAVFRGPVGAAGDLCRRCSTSRPTG